MTLIHAKIEKHCFTLKKKKEQKPMLEAKECNVGCDSVPLLEMSWSLREDKHGHK